MEMATKACIRCGREDEHSWVWTMPREVGGVGDGRICPDCLTEPERRRVEGQCARCERVFTEDDPVDEGDSPLDNEGWIAPEFGDGFVDYLCSACQTAEEDRANTEAFLETVEKGKAIAAEKGDEYPADLDATAKAQEARLREIAAQAEAFARRLDGDG